MLFSSLRLVLGTSATGKGLSPGTSRLHLRTLFFPNKYTHSCWRWTDIQCMQASMWEEIKGSGHPGSGHPKPWMSKTLDVQKPWMSGALSFLSHGCLHTLYVSSSPTATCVPIFLDTLYRTHGHTKYLFLMKTTIQYSPDSAKLAQLTGFVSSQIWFYIVPVSFVIPGNEAQSSSF